MTRPNTPDPDAPDAPTSPAYPTAYPAHPGGPSKAASVAAPPGPAHPVAPARFRRKTRDANAPPDPAAPGNSPNAGVFRMSALNWVLVGCVALLALYLRLREPLSSAIMGAEDPYRHMERTWDLVQGNGFSAYPPGLTALMAPFALMGAGTFYTVARFLPALFGVSAVLGMFFLCRRYLHPAGALTAALVVAAVPELIRRTELLFPTALDLGLLPWFFLAVLLAVEGSRRALITALVLTGVFAVSHPWVLALMAIPMAVFLAIVLLRRHKDRAGAIIGAGVGFLALCVILSFVGPLAGYAQSAFAKLPGVLSNPAGVWNNPPQYVDLPNMLTTPVLLIAAVGLVFAFMRRTPFAWLAISVTLLTLPFVLVDWFGLDYLPHRTVAYFGIGVAMLCAIPVSELFAIIAQARPQAQPGLTFGAVALAALLTVPTGVGMESWYRIFCDNDFKAWDHVAGMDPDEVVAGSWQARAGYRATTGNPAVFSPGFFNNPVDRDFEVQKHPGLIVIVDKYTVSEGQDVSFLNNWHKIDEWHATPGTCSPPDADGSIPVIAYAKNV